MTRINGLPPFNGLFSIGGTINDSELFPIQRDLPRLVEATWNQSALWRTHPVLAEAKLPPPDSFENLKRNFERAGKKDRAVAAEKLLQTYPSEALQYFRTLLLAPLPDPLSKNMFEKYAREIVTALGKRTIESKYTSEVLQLCADLDQKMMAIYSAVENKDVALELMMLLDSCFVSVWATTPFLFLERDRLRIPDWDQSIPYLKQKVAKNEGNFEDFGALIEYSLLKKRADEAKGYFGRLMLHPQAESRSFEMAYLEAEISIGEESYLSAVQVLEPYLAQAKERPVIYVALGEAYYRARQPELAWKMFQLAQKQVEKFPDLWMRIGKTHGRRGDWVAAKNSYERELQYLENHRLTAIEPELWVEAQDRLAVAHWKLGHLDEARYWFSQALGTGHASSSIFYDFATFQFAQGKKAKDKVLLQSALEGFERVVELEGDVADATYGKAKCLEEIGRLEKDVTKQVEARKIYEALANKKPEPYALALYKIVFIRFQDGKYEAMIEFAEKAADLFPDDYVSQFQLAETYRFNDRFQEGFERYQKATALAVQNHTFEQERFVLHYGMAGCLVGLGRLQEARDLITAIRGEINSESPVEWDRLCLIYMALEDTEGINECVKVILEKGEMTPEQLDQAFTKLQKGWKHE